MKNYVKEYLDSGKSLADLKEEFGIDTRVYDDGLVIFSYSQIDIIGGIKNNEWPECRGQSSLQ